MNRYYTKDGKQWYGGKITLNGRTVFNPSHEQLVAAGYEVKETQPYVPTLDEVKAQKIAEIDRYDTSEAVNGFELDGMTMWLDFDTRQRIRSRLPVEKSAGRETTTLWYGTVPVPLPITLAEQLLDSIELYATDCYDVTAAHKAAVQALASIEEVEAYDHTTGYPERLIITTTAEEAPES